MKTLLIKTLKELGYPVKLQGSLEKNEKYPDSFFTFWNNETLSEGFYNNSESKYVWDFDINFYSTNPVLVNNIFNKQINNDKSGNGIISAVDKLKNKGFIISGKGYDLPSDEPTHTGRGINVLYIENYK